MIQFETMVLETTAGIIHKVQIRARVKGTTKEIATQIDFE
jgi:hypothetical protein